MDNASNKPQQTGGLKLMTVFIVIIALHVIVIGGLTMYNLMSGSSTDADLTGDKAHKNGTDSAIASTANPDDAADKTAAAATDPASTPAPAASTDVAVADASTAPSTTTTPALITPAPTAQTPIIIPAPAPEVSAPAPAVVAAPVPTTTQEAPAPAQPSAPAPDADAMAATSPQTPTGPITSSGAPVAADPAPLAGPVHMPSPSSQTAGGEREHGQVYVVKITDSYKKIAHAHHVTVAQLKLANHISGNTLHTGQKLVIPASKMALAEAGGTSLDASENESRLQPTTTAYSTTTLTSDGAPRHHLYTVQRGDTLKKIAHRFNTSPAAILDVNSISNPAKLTIGKRLRIPSSESRSARVTPPAPEPSVAQPAAPSQVQTAPSHMDGESATANGELANFAP